MNSSVFLNCCVDFLVDWYTTGYNFRLFTLNTSVPIVLFTDLTAPIYLRGGTIWHRLAAQAAESRVSIWDYYKVNALLQAGGEDAPDNKFLENDKRKISSKDFL